MGNSQADGGDRPFTGNKQTGKAVLYLVKAIIRGAEIRGHSEWMGGRSQADGTAEMGKILSDRVGQDRWGRVRRRKGEAQSG